MGAGILGLHISKSNMSVQWEQLQLQLHNSSQNHWQPPVVETCAIGLVAMSSSGACLTCIKQGKLWILTAAGFQETDTLVLASDYLETEHSRRSSWKFNPPGCWAVVSWGGPVGSNASQRSKAGEYMLIGCLIGCTFPLELPPPWRPPSSVLSTVSQIGEDGFGGLLITF